MIAGLTKNKRWTRSGVSYHRNESASGYRHTGTAVRKMNEVFIQQCNSLLVENLLKGQAVRFATSLHGLQGTQKIGVRRLDTPNRRLTQSLTLTLTPTRAGVRRELAKRGSSSCFLRRFDRCYSVFYKLKTFCGSRQTMWAPRISQSEAQNAEFFS